MVLVAPRTMEMQEFDIPAIHDQDMLIKVDMVSICGGDPIEYENRNIKTHYPIILGHELVGTVVEVGSQAATVYAVKPGDRVNVEPYILCNQCEYCLSGYYQLCTNARVYGKTAIFDDAIFQTPGLRAHTLQIQLTVVDAVAHQVIQGVFEISHADVAAIENILPGNRCCIVHRGSCC